MRKHATCFLFRNVNKQKQKVQTQQFSATKAKVETQQIQFKIKDNNYLK